MGSLASAQMLGKLEDYPDLHIGIHYKLPDASAVEGMQLYWSSPTPGTLKATGTVQPIKQPSIDFSMPPTAPAGIFAQVRAISNSFRLKPPETWPTKLPNEYFDLFVAHTGLQVKFHLLIRRGDTEAWAACAKLWGDLRAIMPSPDRELIHERN